MCLRAPVSYDKHNSFPHLFISTSWKKTAWNKPKKVVYPPSQHLAALNESISLQSLVACHFGWFQLEPDTHYQLTVGRNERFGELLSQARVTAPKILLLNLGGQVKQSPAGRRFVLAFGLLGEPRSSWQLPPWPQYLWSHTYRITWAERVSGLCRCRGLSVLLWHISARK